MNTGVDSDFKCLLCGNCCTIHGSVDISNEEVNRISDYLGMTVLVFTDAFAELRPSRTGLRLKDKIDGSCIFLQEDRLCRIEEAKPSQCRGFPMQWRYPEWTKVCSANYGKYHEKEMALGHGQAVDATPA